MKLHVVELFNWKWRTHFWSFFSHKRYSLPHKSNSTSSEQNCPPDPSQIYWKYFSHICHPKICLQKNFQPPKWYWKFLSAISSYTENLKDEKNVITKILILSYYSSKFCQKNIRKYVFDVKFLAEHDPGVRKNYKNRGKPENWKKVKNRKIDVAQKPPTYKMSTRRQKFRFSFYFK